MFFDLELEWLGKLSYSGVVSLVVLLLRIGKRILVRFLLNTRCCPAVLHQQGSPIRTVRLYMQSGIVSFWCGSG